MNSIETIRGMMNRKGWGLRRLADAAGIPPGNLSRILTGKRHLTEAVADKLAAALGVEVSPQLKLPFGAWADFRALDVERIVARALTEALGEPLPAMVCFRLPGYGLAVIPQALT